MHTYQIPSRFEAFEPEYVNKNMTYWFFPQTNGFAVKANQLVGIHSGGKKWDKWVTAFSCHIKIRTLKDGNESVNVFLRSRQGRKHQLVNLSRDIMNIPAPLFVKVEIVKHLLHYTEHINANSEEAEEFFQQTLTTLKYLEKKHATISGDNVSVFHAEKGPDNDTLEKLRTVNVNLRKIATSIIYPISLHLHESNIINGTVPRNYTLTKTLRAKNSRQLLSILKLNRKPETQLTVLNNLHKLNYLNINLIRQVNLLIKNDEQTNTIIHKLFNHPIPEQSRISITTETQPWIVNPYAQSHAETVLEALKPVFMKLSPEQFSKIITDSEFIGFLYGLEKPGTVRLPFSGRESKNEMKLITLTLGLPQTVTFTAETYPALLTELTNHVCKYRTKTIDDVINILNEICDGKHLTADTFLHSWQNGWLSQTPAFNVPFQNRVFAGYEYLFPKKLPPTHYLFKFIPYDEVNQIKITPSNPSVRIIFNETAYYNLLNNMRAYAETLCEKYTIPATTTNIAYIIRGMILFNGFTKPTLTRFMKNMQNNATLPLNLYAIRKRRNYTKTNELAQLPTEWVEKMFPQIETYSKKIFIPQYGEPF